MNGDPGPGRLGQLVVHVVLLVQEQLHHQAVLGPGECHLPHRHCGAQPGVEGEAVAVLGVRKGVPVPEQSSYQVCTETSLENLSSSQFRPLKVQLMRRPVLFLSSITLNLLPRLWPSSSL